MFKTFQQHNNNMLEYGPFQWLPFPYGELVGSPLTIHSYFQINCPCLIHFFNSVSNVGTKDCNESDNGIIFNDLVYRGFVND